MNKTRPSFRTTGLLAAIVVSLCFGAVAVRAADSTTTRVQVTTTVTVNPPDLRLTSEPALVRVPGGNAWYASTLSDADLYRVGNTWYVLYNGNWFRADNYRGPWTQIQTGTVPTDVMNAPAAYRRYDRATGRIAPPNFSFTTEPTVILVPNTQTPNVYFVQEFPRADIYRVGSSWWAYYGGSWWRADTWRGPWMAADMATVPSDLMTLPSTYRHFERTGMSTSTTTTTVGVPGASTGSSNYENTSTNTTGTRSPNTETNTGGNTSSMTTTESNNAPFTTTTEPRMVLVRRTTVYYAPEFRDADLYRVNGTWYAYARDRWWRGDSFNGPWTQVEMATVPMAVMRAPGRFHTTSSMTGATGTTTRTTTMTSSRHTRHHRLYAKHTVHRHHRHHHRKTVTRTSTSAGNTTGS